MRRINIPVSEIDTHFRTFSVADEGMGGGGDAKFLCGPTLSINALFWKKNEYFAVYPLIDQLRS